MRTHHLIAASCLVSLAIGCKSAPDPTPPPDVDEASDAPASDASKWEDGVNLEMGDYDYVAAETPDACAEVCESQEQCVAFTWVKAGIQEERALCYLKNEVNARIQDECCVSGVIRP